MSLDKLRDKINHIDIEILNKLDRRMAIAMSAKRFKKKALDRNREIQVIENVKEYAQKLSLIKPEFAEKLFAEIINECRKLQSEEDA